VFGFRTIKVHANVAVVVWVCLWVVLWVCLGLWLSFVCVGEW